MSDLQEGNKESPVNYRPISLTCIACRIFEHIVTSSVMSHLDNQAILVDNQHGFRRGRSCETQLTELTHYLLTSMHNERQTDMIVMDFSKAFDKVSHNKFISSNMASTPQHSNGSEVSSAVEHNL